jgi:hypothetical protein
MSDFRCFLEPCWGPLRNGLFCRQKVGSLEDINYAPPGLPESLTCGSDLTQRKRASVHRLYVTFTRALQNFAVAKFRGMLVPENIGKFLIAGTRRRVPARVTLE